MLNMQTTIDRAQELQATIERNIRAGVIYTVRAPLDSLDSKALAFLEAHFDSTNICRFFHQYQAEDANTEEVLMTFYPQNYTVNLSIKPKQS